MGERNGRSMHTGLKRCFLQLGGMDMRNWTQLACVCRVREVHLGSLGCLLLDVELTPE